MPAPHPPIPIEEIYAARERIKGSVLHTPLVRLNVDDAPGEIYLKLENLQPIGSFKLRGAGNALATARPEQLAKGVYTASAGNMAQGLAWFARRLGLSCTIVVPDHVPEAKLSAITRLGAKPILVPYDEWWQVMSEHTYPPLGEMLFVHPCSDPAVMAGNGTIGLEILEDLPEVDTIVIPYGGGGLSAGIACALRALQPRVKVYACEVETAAPLAPSLAAGSPREVSYTSTFVDGIGAKSLLSEMWPLVSSVLDGSLVVPLDAIAAAIRLLVERNHVVAEGAGATPVAAALSGQAGAGRIVCVISGGNLNPSTLCKILKGESL